MKQYKQCLEQVKTYLRDENLKLDEKKLDSLVSEELEKSANEMDTHLVDLCLNALVAYRIYMSDRQ